MRRAEPDQSIYCTHIHAYRRFQPPLHLALKCLFLSDWAPIGCRLTTCVYIRDQNASCVSTLTQHITKAMPTVNRMAGTLNNHCTLMLCPFPWWACSSPQAGRTPVKLRHCVDYCLAFEAGDRLVLFLLR